MAMTTHTQTGRATKRRRRTALMPPSLTLALWRVKRMWRLLLVAELGTVAAVMLVCAVPLFSQVATAAGLQGALARSQGANELDVHIMTNRPSQQLIQQCERQLAPIISGRLQAYHVGAPSAVELTAQPIKPAIPANGTAAIVPSQSASTNKLALDMSNSHLSGGPSGGIFIDGLSAGDMAKQVRLVQGRLPQPIASGLEVTLTQKTADDLHLKIGSILPLATTKGGPFPLHIVGIITSASTLSGNGFEPASGLGPNGNVADYDVITSNDAIFRSTFDWALLEQSEQIAGPTGQSSGLWNLSWSYPMDLSHLSDGDVGALLDNPQQNDQVLFQVLNSIPNTQNGFAFSEAFDALANYKGRILGAEIIDAVLLLDVLGLVLLFLNLMINVLVDRQEAVIATLRSRGASRRQLFATFATQSVGLGVVALIAGPLLAIPLTRLVAGALLPAQDQHALSVVAGNPFQVAASVGIFAAVTTVVAVLAMLWATRKASGLNVLALRQENTRATRKPLWQRLYLDVLFALLALAGYGSFALANSLAGAQPSGASGNIALLLSPLALIAPIFLMLACSLLFLRVFPLLLRLGEWLAAHGRGAPIVLALTQLARASRRATRMTLLLALTTAFAIFTLSANATITQYIRDSAAYQAGADFSGALTTAAAPGQQGLAQSTATYENIPGVASAALGYRVAWPIQRDTSGGIQAASLGAQLAGPAPNNAVQILAVDSERFAYAALWTQQDSAQSLSSLTALLAGHRNDAAAHGAVYAVVDANTWNQLNLSPGERFTLPVINYNTATMHFIAAAEVQHIPTVYNSASGGMLVDYQSFSAAYADATGDKTGKAIAANFAWLRTKDDAASLASVRAAVQKGPLQLGALPSEAFLSITLADRRSLAVHLLDDPLHIDLIGMLELGAAAALLLALFGTLIAAWLNVRNQLTAFALLRALGAEPRRLIVLLLWQQGIVYTVAVALGVALGALLATVMQPALPNLIFSSSFGGPINNGGAAVRLAWPWPALVAALCALIVICGIALAISARVAARPSLSQTLRLNED